MGNACSNSDNVPQPAPAAQSRPEPKPQADPTPVRTAEPAPVAKPAEPEPEPEPSPAPAPAPAPVPEPAPAAAPEPAPAPAPAPEPATAPEPAPEPAAAPAPASPVAVSVEQTPATDAVAPTTTDGVQAPAAEPEPAPAMPTESQQEAANDLEFEQDRQELDTKTTIAAEETDSDTDDRGVRERGAKLHNLENADEVKNDKDFGVQNSGGDDLFATAEGSEGKQFMAVLPWKGAIFAPSDAPQQNTALTDMDLKMEWVYGYRGYDSYNNVVINSEGNFVYPSAAVCIKYSAKENTQCFFNGHNDDVICLAQSPANPDLIATGQVATIVNRRAVLPHICIWDAKTMTMVTKIPNAHKRAVRCVGFSASGKYLASVGDDNEQTLTIWDVQTGAKLASTETDQAPHKLTSVAWGSDTDLVTTGTKHLYSWSFGSGRLDKKRMLLKGKYSLQTFYTSVFTKKGFVATTTRDGNLYIFAKNHVGYYECVKAVQEHKGAVFCVSLRDNGGLLTGGRDGKLIVWSSRLNIENTYELGTGVCAVYANGQHVVCGTKQCELFAIAQGKGPKLVVTGHNDGELWGLDVHPQAGMNEFASAGEDNKVLFWDYEKHKLVKEAEVSAKAGEKRKRQRASTMSAQPPNRCARLAVYSPDGGNLAIGTNEGELTIIDSKSMQSLAILNLNEFAKQNLTKKWGNWIQTGKYTPDGCVLAVGTHGSVIVLCDVKDNYRPAAKLSAHNAPVTHLDVSADGKHIQSACRAYELLFHDIDYENLSESKQNVHPSQLADTKWKSQTTILGWGVQGIFDPQQDGTDVNCCDLSPDGQVLATGDDYGYINLFRYPVLTNCEHRIFTGHSSHVTNVKFTPDQKHLFSVGGNDKTIIQWSVL